ncbi:hypothetical protein CBS101457_001159 [Exobasidium rhododendri]|nr:hypothetical protein CBS101457_001159 [Exobasidium rhododendri]
MKAFNLALTGAILAATWTLASTSEEHSGFPSSVERRSRPSRMLHAAPSKRSPATDDVQASIVAQAAADPVNAAIAAQGMDGIKDNTDGGDLAEGTLIDGDSESAANPQDNQYPWNYDVTFLPNSDATAGVGGDQGWVALPALSGFDLVRDQAITANATQPFYITSNYTASSIKKAVIVMPGKPRDAWKYTNLIRNALSITAQNFPDLQVTTDSVLIIGPAWLNEVDQEYGAALSTDLVFHGSQWQSGGNSRSPNLTHSITTYDVLDWFTDWLFNTTIFPNLNGVTLAGHSMGGQAVARYALLKKQKKYDDNMQYWIGNPGSWAWLTDARPTNSSGCTDFDDYGYGIGGNTTQISKYARKDVIADKAAVVSRYRKRSVHYSFGLLDNGPGDTHCEAVMQGGNHLDRGSNFVQMLGAMAGGFPTGSQTLSFVANASHQDYAMMSANSSLQNIFKSGYDIRLPDIVASNPSDKNVSNTTEANPNPPARAFATPAHKIISYSLLGGSFAGIVLAFTLLPFLFPTNVQTWEQEEWENDSKRRLLRD